MSNTSGKAYGLTLLCPLINNQSAILNLRNTLQRIDSLPLSPLAQVPNTYLARLYVLEDVFFQNYPYQSEHLKSPYLVFTSNFHGELDIYLEGFYNAIEAEIKEIWQNCIGFDKETMNVNAFKKYIKKCQVETTFFFNGSTDDSLAEQLKSLYIKQEFTEFVYQNAYKDEQTLLAEFNAFIERTKPGEALPTWKAGTSDLHSIVQY